MLLEEIQKDVIHRYNVTVRDYCVFGCRNRMHAHVKERTVCKWKSKKSIRAIFDLFHEIGHIETTKSTMRRCESEYYATKWAMERFKEYDLELPDSIRKLYQDYINRELERGMRRGGKGYPTSLDLG